MPTYCFQCECGCTAELFRPVEQRSQPARCPECRAIMERDYRAEYGQQRFGVGNWPMESFGLGVPVQSIPEMERRCVELGVPTHFNRQTGDAILESRTHRRRLCRALKIHDRNAGYSDPVPD